MDSLAPSLRAGVPAKISLYEAYLEDSQAQEKSYQESLAEAFRRRFAAVKLDLVITANPPALQFAVQYRDRIFPSVPIVFTGVSARELEGQKMWPGITGVEETVGLRETIDLALHLHRDTNAVAVIAGVSPWDKYWLAVAHSELLRHEDKVREIDVVGPPNEELLRRVASLPPHTVALFQLLPQDSNQPAITAYDVITLVTQHLPTYSAWPALVLNRGGVGGPDHDVGREMSETEEIAARVLSGERPENIPVVQDLNLQVQVDWRALQRWHIPQSALPPGTDIEFRPPSAWEQYKLEIIGTLVFVVLLLILIGALLANLMGRRRAEVSLKAMAGELLHAQDEERRRMARDLHDGTAQDVAAISLYLGEVLEGSALNQNGTRHLLEEAHSLSHKVQREVRSVSYALHPPLLDGTGLVPALRWYVAGLMKRSSLRILLDAPPEMEPMAEIDGTLFRIVQESMSNILRHSGADIAKVQLERDSRWVRMTIEDDGHGMDVETPSSNGRATSLGVGIVGMRERVRQFGGTFELRSGSTGTTVLVSLPIS